jgi:hypothetical protein
MKSRLPVGFVQYWLPIAGADGMRVCSGEAEKVGATDVLEYKGKEASLTAAAAR